MTAEGARRFAQFAYPPNELGYCGPSGAEAMLEPDAVDELARRARAFEGAWSYLEALAGAHRRSDPLDADLVEAYWIGGDGLDAVDPATLVAHLERRFVGQVGGTWRAAADRATAHHAFQVFEVYPWAGLLRAGKPPAPAVRVLDECRIRVGEVRAVEDESVVVVSRRLAWSAPVLREGPDDVVDRARWAVDGRGLIAAPEPGDLVALHWDWVCAVITPAQADQIRTREATAMAGAGLLG